MSKPKHEREMDKTAFEKWASEHARPCKAEEIIAMLPEGLWPLVASLMVYQRMPLTIIAKFSRIPWKRFRRTFRNELNKAWQEIKKEDACATKP